MSYIGNTPTTQNFVAGADQFSGTGSQTVFTLSRNVNTVFDMFVTVSNVPQDPYSAYSVSGNTLTFTSAPPSGTDNIYVTYRATNVQTFVPSPGATVGGNFNVTGNLGVGTTSPTSIATYGSLSVNGSVGGLVDLMENGTYRMRLAASSSSAIMYSNGAIPIVFAPNNAEQMRIDSSGNVGIGSTSITRAYANYNQLNLNGTSGATIQMQAGGTSYANFVADSNALYVQGQTAIAFGVGGSGTGTERARIDSSGSLLVGTTSVGDHKVIVSSTSQWALGLAPSPYPANGNAYSFIVFRKDTSSGTAVGSITSAGTTTAYNTSSDYRLKENVQPMQNALAKVTALKPCTYTWKSDGSDGEGFIAHELAEVAPYAVTGEKDAVNEDGSIKPQGIDTSFLVATLTAAIQELNAKVEAQAAEIAALKGAA